MRQQLYESQTGTEIYIVDSAEDFGSQENLNEEYRNNLDYILTGSKIS